MKKIIYYLAIIPIFGLLACSEEEEVEVNTSSIIPLTTADRENEVQGCIEIEKRTVVIEAWDGQTIDGDIISIYANKGTADEEIIISQQELDGPSNKIRVTHTFKNGGYNYITLYAHNLGSLPPNTAAISVDGVPVTLSANLNTNGALDVVVKGFGVSCDD
jgi:hypothetical protein